MKKINYGLLAVALLALPGCRSYYRASLPQPMLMAVTDTSTSTNPAARRMAAYLKPYQDSLHRGMDLVLAQSAEEIGKGRPESKLGNLLTDMMLSAARASVPEGVDVAHLNMGGIRTVLKKGNVSLGDVYEIMPFDNKLIVAVLPGPLMQQFLQWEARRQDPQAGMQLVIRGDSLVSARIGGQPFEPTRTYRVAMSDYIFNGGDAADFMKKNKVQLIDTRQLIRDVLVAGFKQAGKEQKPILVVPDERTKVISN